MNTSQITAPQKIRFFKKISAFQDYLDLAIVKGRKREK